MCPNGMGRFVVNENAHTSKRYYIAIRTGTMSTIWNQSTHVATCLAEKTQAT